MQLKGPMKRSLSIKMTALWLVTVLALSIPILMLQILLAGQNITRESMAYRQGLESRIAGTYGEVIWNYDIGSLEKMVRQELADPRIGAIRIRYGHTVTLLWLGKKPDGGITPVESFNPVGSTNHRIIPVARVLGDGGEQFVAEVEIWYDSSSGQKRIKEMLGYLVIQTLALMLASGIALDHLARRKLVHPLERIQETFGSLQDESHHLENDAIVSAVPEEAFSEIRALAEEICSILDVRDRMSQKLLEREAQYRNLVENIPGIVYRMNITQADAKDFLSGDCEKITGYSQEQLGGYQLWLEIIHPDDRVLMNLPLEREHGHDSHYEREYRIIKKFGEWVWIKDSLNLVETENGTVAEGVIVDVTDSVHAREALISSNDTLESLVSRRTLQLSEANARLEEALVTLQETQRQAIETEIVLSQGRLISGLLHEMNTPLGNAITLASYLKACNQEACDALNQSPPDRGLGQMQEFCDAVTQLEKNLDRASVLMSVLRPLSTIRDSQINHPVNPGEIVDHAVDEVLYRFPGYEVAYRMKNRVRTPQLFHGDALKDAIEQLTENALIHGFEATRKGKLTVEIQMEGQYLQVSFQDDGRGLDRQVQEGVFEPFVSSKRQSGKLGVGMNIVKKCIVQDLGGSIQLYQPEYGGLGVLMVFPVMQPSPQP